MGTVPMSAPVQENSKQIKKGSQSPWEPFFILYIIL